MIFSQNNIILFFICIVIIYLVFYKEEFSFICPPNSVGKEWELIDNNRCGLNCKTNQTKNNKIKVGKKWCTGTQTAVNKD